ncbi:MAG TPA: 3-hydroxybutyrate dehydrogenase [Calditerricola sp.]
MMRDKVVLITGAASGIGRAMAEAFAAEGGRCVLLDQRGEAVAQLARELAASGREALGLACDVTDEEALNACIDRAVERYGRLDVLINNAGLQHVAPIDAFPTEAFRRLIDVMLVAPFLAIKRAFPVMKRQRFGRILNIASINGLVGFAGKAAYNSAKHGVIGLTKVAALEGAAHGITVNALCPGYVDTLLVRNQLADLARTRGVPVDRVIEAVLYPLIPQKRLLTPQEVADYALFLCSDRAGGVTGQAVVIDGGYTAQ